MKKKVIAVFFRPLDAAVSRSKNIQIQIVRGIRTQLLKAKIPSKNFDILLVTSKNALLSVRQPPSAALWVAIGDKTSKAFKIPQLSKLKIVSPSTSKGVLDFFRASFRGPQQKKSVFFPRSKIADPELPKNLRSLGHRVTVRPTYTTKVESVRTPLLRILKKAQRTETPVALCLTSSSCVKSLKRSLRKSELKALHPFLLAIGPATAASLKKWGFRPLVARKARIESLLQTASRLSRRLKSRSD